MLGYVVRRVPSALLILFLASVVIFSVIRLVPGDPATTLAGPDATDESLDTIRADLGLDEPVVVQYFDWIRGVMTFDFGTSYMIGGSIGSLLADGLANTIILTATALLLAIVVALLLSTLSVIYERRWLKALTAGFNTMAVALPTFVTGLLLVVVLAVVFPVLPAGGTPPDGFVAKPDIAAQYLMLPAVCLALPTAAALTRFLTEALHTQMEQPYVMTATALGISRRRVVLTQALRNALPPAVTVTGIQLGTLLGGAVIVEVIFAWPGLGQLVEQGISRRDYPVVQILLLVSVLVFVTTQLVTDLLHAYLDPRVRLGGAR